MLRIECFIDLFKTYQILQVTLGNSNQIKEKLECLYHEIYSKLDLLFAKYNIYNVHLNGETIVIETLKESILNYYKDQSDILEKLNITCN